MKILTIHADFIEFEAKKKAFKGAEEGVEKGKKEKVEECLVVFTAVEKRDEKNTKAVLHKYLQEINNIAHQVNAKNIVLYPYAHLSSQLSDPKIAENLMKEAQQELSKKYSVFRAPFGWYKSFNISCKGHPLSELSREFGPEQELNLKKEGKDEPFEFSDKELSHDQKVMLTGAFLLGKAVKNLFPKAETAASGFYHDYAYMDFSGVDLKNEDLKKIEHELGTIQHEHLDIAKVPVQELTGSFHKGIVEDLGSDSSAYTFDGVKIVPLFRDPFVSPQEVKVLKILNQSRVYWKNNANNSQLTRIYLAAFDSAEKLDSFLEKVFYKSIDTKKLVGQLNKK